MCLVGGLPVNNPRSPGRCEFTPAGLEKSNSTQSPSQTEPPPPLPARAERGRAAQRTQPMEGPWNLPDPVAGCLGSSQIHRCAATKERPAIPAPSVWGPGRVAPPAPTAHTRPSRPRSASAGIAIPRRGRSMRPGPVLSPPRGPDAEPLTRAAQNHEAALIKGQCGLRDSVAQ